MGYRCLHAVGGGGPHDLRRKRIEDTLDLATVGRAGPRGGLWPPRRPPGASARVAALLDEGRDLDAILAYQETTGADLPTAVRVVAGIKRRRGAQRVADRGSWSGARRLAGA